MRRAMAFDIGWMVAMTSVLLTSAEKSHLEWGLPAKQMDDHDSVDDPLHTAVREGNVEEVEALLASGRSRLTVRDSLGYTPLHRASDDGLSNVVRVLLKHGAGAGPATNSVGTVLERAGTSIESRDHDAATPLMLAASGGHVECIRLLVGAGASLTATDEVGLTALHYAAEVRTPSTFRVPLS